MNKKHNYSTSFMVVNASVGNSVVKNKSNLIEIFLARTARD